MKAVIVYIVFHSAAQSYKYLVLHMTSGTEIFWFDKKIIFKY